MKIWFILYTSGTGMSICWCQADRTPQNKHVCLDQLTLADDLQQIFFLVQHTNTNDTFSLIVQ